MASFDPLTIASSTEAAANAIRAALQSGSVVCFDVGHRNGIHEAASHLSLVSTKLSRPDADGQSSKIGSALDFLKCALACVRLLRNACAVGKESRAAVAAAGSVEATMSLLSFLSRDCLLREHIEGGDSELSAALKELKFDASSPLGAPSSASAVASGAGNADDWSSTAKLAVKASWQLLSNSVTSLLASTDRENESSRSAIASDVFDWLTQQESTPSSSPSSFSSSCYLHEAIASWSRDDATLLPIVGWLVYHVTAHHLGRSSTDERERVSALWASRTPRSSSSCVLKVLLSLAGSGGKGSASMPGSSATEAVEADWLTHLLGLLRAAGAGAERGLLLSAYAAVGDNGSSSNTSRGGFLASFEQLVFLQALAAELEEAASSARASSSSGAEAGRAPSLSDGDVAGLWAELGRLCSWLVEERKKQIAASAASTSGTCSAAAGAAVGDPIASVIASCAQHAVILIAGILADHEAAAHERRSSSRSSPGTAAAPPLPPWSTSLQALSHALAAYHRPIHRQEGRKSKREEEEREAEERSHFVLSGAVDCFRLLAVALSADCEGRPGVEADGGASSGSDEGDSHDAAPSSLAEALARDCPGLVPLLYYHAQKMEEERPTLREWAVLGLKALLGHSVTAARVMKDLDDAMRAKQKEQQQKAMEAAAVADAEEEARLAGAK